MYREAKPFEDRCLESRTMRARYPERVPIIIEPKGRTTPMIDKRKYMAPKDITFSQLFYVVRKRLSMGSEKGLFFFMEGGTIVPASALVHETYNKHHDLDGFMYISYSIENTFG